MPAGWRPAYRRVAMQDTTKSRDDRKFSPLWLREADAMQ